MKKITLALCALLFGFFVASCNNQKNNSKQEDDEIDFFEKIEGLTKDVEKNSDDWETEEWVNVLKEALDAAIEFMDKNDIKEKDFEKMTDAVDELWDACRDSDSSAFIKATNKRSIEILIDKYNKKVQKLNKKIKEDENNKDDNLDNDSDYTKESFDKDYIAAVKELMNDVSANWTADDWSDFMERYATLYIEFMESKPSEQLFRQFESIEPNMSNLSEEAQATAMKGIMQFTESSPLFQKVQDMQEELEKTFK